MTAPTGIELAGGPHACLVLHGLCGSPLEVRFVAKLMQRAGFSVHVPLVRGYGMRERCTGWQAWIDEAEGEYERLVPRYKTVSVAGLSSGATLALALAERRAVQALALWAVMLYYDGWAIPWYRGLFEPGYRLGLGGLYGYREQWPFGLKNERWRSRVAEAMRAHEQSSAGPALIPSEFLFHSTVLGRRAARALEKVTSDVIVIHAADDETASPRNAEEVHERVRSRHKRRIMLGDSYHIITMDNERELVARETIRFLQQSILRSHPGETVSLVSSSRALLRLQRRRAAQQGA